MKFHRFICIVALLFVTRFAFSQGSVFTYQGRLNDNVGPVTGLFDLRFILRDAASAGNALATNTLAPVAVTNGLFTVLLDFGGSAFTGSSRWLQIGVRPNGSGAAHTFVAPYQAITPIPYAIHSADAGIPTGSIMAYMGTNAPSGWLLCDGSAISRTTNAQLFAVIGMSNGSGDGSTTFNLPDLRGQFLRGLDGTAGVDPDKATRTAAKSGGNTGNALGSAQVDDFKSHNHGNGAFNRALQQSFGTSTTVTTTDIDSTEPDVINSAPLASAGGNESRPKNIYVNYIIKL